MELKHKTLNLFIEKYHDKLSSELLKDRYFFYTYHYCFNYAVQYVEIKIAYNRRKGEKILVVSQPWYNPHPRYSKYFPCTWEGFVKACDWLDKKRLAYVEESVQKITEGLL